MFKLKRIEALMSIHGDDPDYLRAKLNKVNCDYKVWVFTLIFLNIIGTCLSQVMLQYSDYENLELYLVINYVMNCIVLLVQAYCLVSFFKTGMFFTQLLEQESKINKYVIYCFMGIFFA